MNDMIQSLILAGYMAIGIAIGFSIGIIIGKKQKPWSEMTEEEKRNRKIIISTGIIILIFGFLIGLLKFLDI